MSRGRAFRRVLPAVAVAGVAALLAALTSLFVAAAGPAGASAKGNGGARLSLVSQSNWVQPQAPGSPANFTLTLSVAGAPSGSQVSVALYSRLHTRSGFEATLRSPPSQSDTAEIDHTDPVALSSLSATHGGGLGLRVSVVPSASASAAPPPASGTPTLDLGCSASATSCTGVYPAVVSLLDPAGADLAHFTTYLTYVQATSTHRLRFAWVVPLSATTSVRAGRGAARALGPLTSGTATALERLIAALHRTGVPVTIEPAAQTVQALAGAGSAGRQAVTSLALMSGHPSVDETVAQTFVPVDLGALAGAGEPTEITAQVKEASQVLGQYGVAVSSPTTWIATGKVGASTGTGLAQVGAKQVVVPDDQLATPPSRVTGVPFTGTWAWPFTLPFGARGPTLTAAEADNVLTSQFDADPADPALAAVKVLADLAMVHFEAPYTTHARGMVGVPPAGWQPSTAFDSQLLAGLQGNPVVEPVTLSGFFATGPPAPVTRRLQSSGAGPALPAAMAHRLSADRLRLTAFVGAVEGRPAILTQLDQALLAAEADYRSARGMRHAVDAFDRVFGRQLSQIHLSPDRTITLTARTGWIPVTVESSAPYTVRGTLTLSSAKFKFPPSGSGCTTRGHRAQASTAVARSTSCSLALAHATNPVRVDVEARTLGDSPVTVVFSVPGLVLARGRLVVRSTATSVVGVILTAVALAVLLGWWGRTWWNGRRRRRAARGAAAGGR